MSKSVYLTTWIFELYNQLTTYVLDAEWALGDQKRFLSQQKLSKN